MALTKYKATKEYRDPNTGTIYLDGAGGRRQNTATPTSNGTVGGVTIADRPSTVTGSTAVQSPSDNVLYGLAKQKTTQRKTTSGSSGYSYDDFTTSPDTDRYKTKLTSLESNKPDAFESRYDSLIQNLVHGITNRKAFDVDTDVNYNRLYDNYKERYETEADKAMRDTMASANAATGGYGSTYGQVAAQQQYDTTMQGLNDQNLNLMQLAYQMYGDETADRYNQLNAIAGLDNTDYSRYRDGVDDYYRDLNYYAGRYDTGYGNDLSKWDADRTFDYNSFVNDRSYDNTVSEQEYEKYQNAISQANQLASAGLTVPDYITAVINAYNKKYGYGSGDATTTLQQLASQAAALAASKKGRSGNSSGGESSSDEPINNNIAWDVAKDKRTSRTAAIEAIDEAYWNYYSGILPTSSARGKAEALNQAMQNYKNATGITDGATIKAHFDKLVKDRQKGK